MFNDGGTHDVGMSSKKAGRKEGRKEGKEEGKGGRKGKCLLFYNSFLSFTSF